MQEKPENKPQLPETRETPAIWVDEHLRITDPETKQELLNKRA